MQEGDTATVAFGVGSSFVVSVCAFVVALALMAVADARRTGAARAPARSADRAGHRPATHSAGAHDRPAASAPHDAGRLDGTADDRWRRRARDLAVGRRRAPTAAVARRAGPEDRARRPPTTSSTSSTPPTGPCRPTDGAPSTSDDVLRRLGAAHEAGHPVRAVYAVRAGDPGVHHRRGRTRSGRAAEADAWRPGPERSRQPRLPVRIRLKRGRRAGDARPVRGRTAGRPSRSGARRRRRGTPASCRPRWY